MSGRTDRSGSAVVNVLAFVAAFGAVLVLARSLWSRPPVSVLDTKQAQFAATKDEIDVLFIGSSCVYRAVVPEVFDAEAAHAGLNLRSFNFGLPGQQPPEVRERLRRIFELRPARLRYVVVELLETNLEIPERNRQVARTLDWHTPSQTAWLCDTIWRSDDPLRVKLAKTRSHLVPFATSLFLLGRGSDWVQRSWEGGGPNEEEFLEPEPEQRGYVPLESETAAQCRERADELTRNWDQFRRHLAVLRSPRPRKDVYLESDRRILTDIQADIVEHGAVPIFLITPERSPYHHLVQLHDRGWLQRVIAFNDLDRYPQFYDPSHRYDLAHLNQRGAREFSALLAREFVSAARSAEPSAAKHR